MLFPLAHAAHPGDVRSHKKGHTTRMPSWLMVQKLGVIRIHSLINIYWVPTLAKHYSRGLGTPEPTKGTKPLLLTALAWGGLFLRNVRPEVRPDSAPRLTSPSGRNYPGDSRLCPALFQWLCASPAEDCFQSGADSLHASPRLVHSCESGQ